MNSMVVYKINESDNLILCVHRFERIRGSIYLTPYLYSLSVCVILRNNKNLEKKFKISNLILCGLQIQKMVSLR